jgi:hypothetical protein
LWATWFATCELNPLAFIRYRIDGFIVIIFFASRYVNYYISNHLNDFLKLLFIFVLLLKEADRINQPEFIIVNVKIIEVKPSNSILTRVKLRDVQSSMLN